MSAASSCSSPPSLFGHALCSYCRHRRAHVTQAALPALLQRVRPTRGQEIDCLRVMAPATLARRKSVSVAVVAVALLAAARAALARSGQSLLRSPGPSDATAWAAPVHYNHTALGPIHGAGAPVPPGDGTRWMIAQWSNPDALNAGAADTSGSQGACSRGDVQWSLATPTVRVCWYKPDAAGHHAVELAQSGSAPGQSQLPCGHELDTFLSPTGDGHGTYTNTPIGMDASDPLDSLASLTVELGAEMVYAGVKDRCGTSPQCGGGGHVDYGYATVGVILSNSEAKQTIFYQIGLFDTRQQGACPSYQGPCVAGHRNWYFSKNPFGVTDSVATFDGAECLTAGKGQGRVQYAIDVLPQLKSAVLEGPPSGRAGLSGNLTQWRHGGLYIGVGMQGSATQTLVVDSVDVVQVPLPA